MVTMAIRYYCSNRELQKNGVMGTGKESGVRFPLEGLPSSVDAVKNQTSICFGKKQYMQNALLRLASSICARYLGLGQGLAGVGTLKRTRGSAGQRPPAWGPRRPQ